MLKALTFSDTTFEVSKTGRIVLPRAQVSTFSSANYFKYTLVSDNNVHRRIAGGAMSARDSSQRWGPSCCLEP